MRRSEKRGRLIRQLPPDRIRGIVQEFTGSSFKMREKFFRHKRIWIAVALELIIGAALIRLAAGRILTGELTARRENAEANAQTYSERIEEDINSGIYITDSLEQIIISEDGSCNQFHEVAENLMNDSIQSIQLAPGGTVTEIYPEKGNEAGKIDLLADPSRGEYARYGMENDLVISQGPFDLKQGGRGLAVRNPVYLNHNGHKEFWGFTIVIIRVPDIFFNSMKALESFGYQCRLLKTTSPWSQEYTEVYDSGEEMIQPVSYQFGIGGDTWQLQVMPRDGWDNSGLRMVVICSGWMIVLLLTGLTAAVMILEERRRYLRELAETDGLTGLYNRRGFDRLLDRYLARHPDSRFVVAELDIDNFKSINDMYGHDAGDQALRVLAAELRKNFPRDAVIGRNGGDEFCLLLKNQTYRLPGSRLEDFTKSHKEFCHKGEKHPFTISLGYAEYPVHAQKREELMQCADAALYEVKRKGKQGCIMYREGFQQIRKQMGFALTDISENLPGAFLVYKADPQNDELLFANQEMLHLTGCGDLDEFFAYTRRSFRNLLDESDREAVEADIWRQINANGGQENDYVSFSLVRKDGTKVRVFDHGRLVDSTYYGRVFYVLLMNKKLIDAHYGQGCHPGA